MWRSQISWQARYPVSIYRCKIETPWMEDLFVPVAGFLSQITDTRPELRLGIFLKNLFLIFHLRSPWLNAEFIRLDCFPQNFEHTWFEERSIFIKASEKSCLSFLIGSIPLSVSGAISLGGVLNSRWRFLFCYFQPWLRSFSLAMAGITHKNGLARTENP